jgi:YegS/Rv2252/BmrU family lipid kinase
MAIPERCIVINPAAAAGKTGKKASEILALLERHLGRNYTLFMTGRPGEATKSVRWAITAGARLIVAVGGDGTLQEVVNGFFSEGAPLSPDCRLGIVNAGTGAGFAQSFGLPADLEAQAALIAHGQARRIDIGRAVYANGGDRPEERYFLNECQAGIGGEVVRKVEARNKKSKKLGGRFAFAVSTLGAALRYPNRAMSVEIDGRPAGTFNMVAVIMANGCRMAGGMRLAPRARLDDGLLDVLFIHEQSVGERLRNFRRIYSGRHTDNPGFSYFRARSVAITSEEKTDFEADGELWGSLPCRVDVLPAALRVVCPNPFGA